MKKNYSGYLFILLTTVIFSTMEVMLRYTRGLFAPMQITYLRFLIGGIALIPFALSSLKKHGAKLRPRDLAYFALTGFMCVSFSMVMYQMAILRPSASFVSVAVSTAPLFTAALGFVVLKEKGFGVRFVVGFVLAIAGIALISFQEGPAHASTLGVLLCLLGAGTWAVYSVIVKRMSDLGYETIAATKRIFAWGLLYMVITRVAQGGAFPVEAFSEPLVLGNLAFLGLLASAGCFVTWGYSVKHLGSGLASAYIYLQAPITVVWAVILLGEPLTGAIVAGFVLVIAGLALSEGFDRKLAALLARSQE